MDKCGLCCIVQNSVLSAVLADCASLTLHLISRPISRNNTQHWSGDGPVQEGGEVRFLRRPWSGSTKAPRFCSPCLPWHPGSVWVVPSSGTLLLPDWCHLPTFFSMSWSKPLLFLSAAFPQPVQLESSSRFRTVWDELLLVCWLVFTFLGIKFWELNCFKTAFSGPASFYWTKRLILRFYSLVLKTILHSSESMTLNGAVLS